MSINTINRPPCVTEKSCSLLMHKIVNGRCPNKKKSVKELCLRLIFIQDDDGKCIKKQKCAQFQRLEVWHSMCSRESLIISKQILLCSEFFGRSFNSPLIWKSNRSQLEIHNVHDILLSKVLKGVLNLQSDQNIVESAYILQVLLTSRVFMTLYAKIFFIGACFFLSLSLSILRPKKGTFCIVNKKKSFQPSCLAQWSILA